MFSFCYGYISLIAHRSLPDLFLDRAEGLIEVNIITQLRQKLEKEKTRQKTQRDNSKFTNNQQLCPHQASG